MECPMEQFVGSKVAESLPQMSSRRVPAEGYQKSPWESLNQKDFTVH